MRTNNKLLAMFLLATLLASGIVIIADSDDADASTEVGTPEALVAAVSTSGFDIKLSGDITVTSTVEITNSGTIDLNGYTLSGDSCRALWIKEGNVTLTGTGTVNSVGSHTKSFDGSSSVIRVGAKVSSSNPAGLFIDRDVTVTTKLCYAVTVFGINAGGQTLVVKGCVSNYDVDAAAISGNGSKGLSSTSITIANTAVVYSEKGIGMYHPQAGTLTIDGEIEGVGGVEIKAGSTNVAIGNAIITATAESTTHNPNNNGNSTTGYALVLVKNENYKGGMSAVISDGMFTGPIGIVEDKKPGTETPTIMITGGIFTKDPSEFVPAGYEATLVSGIYYVGAESDDGSITVEETEETEDGTIVSTESVIKTNESGKVTSATVTITTADSTATARIDSSGTSTLTSDTTGTLYLSDTAVENLVELMKSASGSDSVTLDVTSAGSAVSLGYSATTAISTGDLELSITVNRGSSAQATVTLNSESLEAGSTYVLSVESNPSMAGALKSAGLTGTTPFDIELTSDGVIVNLDGSVTISVPVDGKYDNMRMYCIDNGDSYAASYSAGSVTATIDHFSTWAVVYDKPVVVVDNEDDVLFILEQQKKAREAASQSVTSSDNTEEEAAIIIAAAAVAGAMLACAFFAFRRP